MGNISFKSGITDVAFSVSSSQKSSCQFWLENSVCVLICNSYLVFVLELSMCITNIMQQYFYMSLYLLEWKPMRRSNE